MTVDEKINRKGKGTETHQNNKDLTRRTRNRNSPNEQGTETHQTNKEQKLTKRTKTSPKEQGTETRQTNKEQRLTKRRQDTGTKTFNVSTQNVFLKPVLNWANVSSRS